ncbi:MAG: 16S rRNA (cytosine(1402)-N(4))-methyltransferase RsmH [Planctomycetota bacterium]|jgi:16S rRNA (cytosine1402-N4)-methyltransferase|nr:16S rRNA (cytosine(1402)-N(4))-methyltransferase RsmH [Planctomycetota bacterium]
MAKGYGHEPVMPEESCLWLDPRPGQTVIDMTTGLGGHSRLFGEAIGATGRLVCVDRDREALEAARENLLSLECGVDFIHSPFDRITGILASLDIKAVDRVFFDIGVSSLQLDKAERGFSFLRDGPLDMRMDRETGPNAADLVNSLPVEELADIFYRYGEERHSRRIAKRIGEAREISPINTTGELSAIIAGATSGRAGRNPATKVFQALRIAVNDELGMLSRGLAGAGKALAPGGRVAVLTFHSIEDRMVKRVFAGWAKRGLTKTLAGGVVEPTHAETLVNRRARSAKLRAAERIQEFSLRRGRHYARIHIGSASLDAYRLVHGP